MSAVDPSPLAAWRIANRPTLFLVQSLRESRSPQAEDARPNFRKRRER